MMMRRTSALLALALVGGCAAQQEEAARGEAEPAGDRYYDEVEQDMAAPIEAAPAEESERAPTLAEIERELAANNAKLRELGVELATLEATTKKDEAGGDGELGRGSGSSAGGFAPAPGAQPSGPSKSTDRDKSERRPTNKPADKPVNKEAKAKGDADGIAEPSPAKAAPLTPSGGARDQGAVGRCEQICELSEISCSLGGQICELADRHPDEEDYASACERANLDCDAAKEACDVCVE